MPELNTARGEFLLAGQHVGTCAEPGQPSAGSAEAGDCFRPPRRLAEPRAVVPFELGELQRRREYSPPSSRAASRSRAPRRAPASVPRSRSAAIRVDAGLEAESDASI